MNNKKNNKGFSLIELIVVVAIMAVLVGVLAPTYLKYVENSRVQKDISAVGEFVQAIKVAAADEDVNKALSDATVEYTIDANGAVYDTLTDDLTTELKTTIEDVKLNAGSITSVEVSAHVDGGILEISVEATGDNAEAVEDLEALSTVQCNCTPDADGKHASTCPLG